MKLPSKLRRLIFLFILLGVLSGMGQTTKISPNEITALNQNIIEDAKNGWWAESMKSHEDRIQWWRDAHFGMFIHWGIYSLPGGEWKGKAINGYAEHLMRKKKISKEEYLKLAHRFNPVNFDAEKWVLSAKETGMKYIIITAKHHDGFAMYDSKVSQFNIIDQTSFKRDPLKELAEACEKYNMKFGFYYSHAFDWEDPNAPGNDWEYQNPGGDRNLYGGRKWYDSHPELIPKIEKYIYNKALPQITELIKKYHPDILWFDTPHKIPFYENLKILKAIRKIDSRVVINGRLARTDSISFGDYKNTSDRPVEFYPVSGDWEAIPTTNESYGYNKHDNSHKPPRFFIHLLAKATAKGGNLLMNIGPRGDGTFDPKDQWILRRIGKWLSINGESIYEAHKSTLPIQQWGVVTQGENKIYLHVFDWPKDDELILGGLKNKVKKAFFLSDSLNKPLPINRLNSNDLKIDLPKTTSDINDSVLVLETSKPIIADSTNLLMNTQPNSFLAFDAKLKGEGFKFGDGKKDRYYVENWKNTNQSLSWPLRVNTATSFKVVLKFVESTDQGGLLHLKMGRKFLQVNIPNGVENGKVQNLNMGEITLQPDRYECILNAENINDKQLIKLLEIKFIPLK